MYVKLSQQVCSSFGVVVALVVVVVVVVVVALFFIRNTSKKQLTQGLPYQERKLERDRRKAIERKLMQSADQVKDDPFFDEHSKEVDKSDAAKALQAAMRGFEVRQVVGQVQNLENKVEQAQSLFMSLEESERDVAADNQDSLDGDFDEDDPYDLTPRHPAPFLLANYCVLITMCIAGLFAYLQCHRCV